MARAAMKARLTRSKQLARIAARWGSLDGYCPGVSRSRRDPGCLGRLIYRQSKRNSFGSNHLSSATLEILRYCFKLLKRTRLMQFCISQLK